MSQPRPALAGIVLFWESIDIETVLYQCRRRNPGILFASTGSHHLFHFLNKPSAFGKLTDKNHWIQFKHAGWSYLTYPLRLMADQIQIACLLAKLLLKTRRPIPVALLNHLYHMPAFLLLRKIGLVRRLVYVSGDWLADQHVSGRFWSRIGSRIAFPWFDRLACAGSDRVLQITKRSKNAREKYWGKKIVRDEEYFFAPIKAHFKKMLPALRRNRILFLGAVRADSGLELLLPILKELHRRHGIRLKLAGPIDTWTDTLARQIKQLGLQQAVQITGSFDRINLLSLTSDCFCGLNLSTDRRNFSRYTLPAKSLDYLQYGLPIVTNTHIGEMAEWVRRKKLGAVISLQSEALGKTLRLLFKNQKTYRRNISDFLEKYEGTDFGKFFPAA
ncbi:MAG: glycosyltransferase [Spirochaetia bacterium]|nr:glycosyltransferase [Spirochaetia bacterium]